ncbi:hypothetical protein ACWF94_10300 [Streptomyces sp. NPDC055078]
MVGGIVRTPLNIGETHDCGPLPIRADTVRTRPDTEGPDRDPGVRFAYRATVPRHLMGAAFTEAFGHLADALQSPEEPKPPAPLASPARRDQIAEAVADAYDLPPDILRKDPTA